MIIREFKASDLDEIVVLFMDVFNQPPWNNRWSNDNAKELIQDFINTRGFMGYIARDESEDSSIVGVVLGREKKWWRGKEYYIEEFFVRAELQGRGYGTQMLEFVYEDIKNKGIRRVALLTDKNSPAFNFYTNKDFKEHQSLCFLYKEI